jgi:hypothetical protein
MIKKILVEPHHRFILESLAIDKKEKYFNTLCKAEKEPYEYTIGIDLALPDFTDYCSITKGIYKNGKFIVKETIVF